jgi:hypothetical protein
MSAVRSNSHPSEVSSTPPSLRQDPAAREETGTLTLPRDVRDGGEAVPPSQRERDALDYGLGDSAALDVHQS